MSFRAYAGVDARDFARSQVPSAARKSVSDVSAFAEYARFITDAHDLRMSAQKALRSLLKGADSETENHLACDIMTAMSTVLKINIALHLKSRGVANSERVLQIKRPAINTATQREQVFSAIYGPEATLPPDFSWPLLQRMHRFASGLEIGTIQHGEEVLTIEHDPSADLDLCSILNCPGTLDELRASKILWQHSTKIKVIVENCVEVPKSLKSSTNSLELPTIASVISTGIHKERCGVSPYDASRALRCIQPVASGLTHIVRAARSAGKGNGTEADSSPSSR